MELSGVEWRGVERGGEEWRGLGRTGEDWSDRGRADVLLIIRCNAHVNSRQANLRVKVLLRGTIVNRNKHC